MDKNFEQGNRSINAFMGYPYNFDAYPYQISYHKDWNWIMPVVDKIHNLEEEYPEVKNNFHIIIAKRFTRFIYDWDIYCDHDKASETKEGFEKFQKASKDYRHVIFENNPLYSTWKAVVDFIEWWNEKKDK